MSNATNSQLGVMPEDTGTTQGADKPLPQEQQGATVRTETKPQDTPKPAAQAKEDLADFTAFQEVLGETPLSDGIDSKSDDKKEEKKSDDKQAQTQTKPEVKVNDNSQKPEQQKEQQVPDKSKEAEEDIAEVANDIRKGQKDYSGLNEEEVKIFRRMSQKTFEYLKPIYLQHKEQKAQLEANKTELEKLRSGALPDSYLQHPRAYTLTPEFENAANTYRKAQMIVEHWQGQLEKLNAGDEEYQEIHVDPSNGDLYLGKAVKADRSSVGEVSQILARTQTQLQRIGGVVQGLATNHSSKVEADVKQIRDFETTSFPHFNTEEGKKVLMPLIKDTIAKVLPASHHNNPLAEGYAKALLTIQHLGALVKSLQGKGGEAGKTNGTTTTTQQQTNAQTNAQKAGPTNASMAAASAGADKGGEANYNDFLEVMGRKG